MHANIRMICSDCGCEIDHEPGCQPYIVDHEGFHHARRSDCGKSEPIKLRFFDVTEAVSDKIVAEATLVIAKH